MSDKAAPTPAMSAAAPEVVMPKPGATKPGQTERLTIAVEWTDPPAWKRLPHSSPMRAATYHLPSAEGDKELAEVAVFYFGPGQGGSVDSNIERWARQFGMGLAQVDRSNREVNGLKQHVAEIKKGDFSPGMMGPNGPPKKDWSLVGAIVEAPSGSYFFKLTGPEKTVKAQRETFFKLLDSVKTRQ